MSKPAMDPIERQRRTIARTVARLVVPQCISIATPQAAKAKPASGVFGSM